jgi:hypothetical protein
VTVRASAIIGMVAAAVWLVALFAEYRLGLQPPGDGSAAYRTDQAAFALAQFGYLIMLVGLFRSRAGGDGTFGRIAILIWVIGIAALALGQFLALIGIVFVPLLPIGGLGQVIGAILTAIAVWRARRWQGWRRLAPAIWATYTFFLLVSVAVDLPGLTTPAQAPNPTTSPTELTEALWEVAWFLVGLALYIESGRNTKPLLQEEKPLEVGGKPAVGA